MRFKTHLKKTVDLRKDYDEKFVLKSKSDKSRGILYLKDNVVQVWWERDTSGRKIDKPETWTAPNDKQAKENYEDMKTRLV